MRNRTYPDQRVMKERHRFAAFGEQVGIAFQIADDLLDFVGDSDTTGKEPGNDLLNGKVTLPLIYALRRVSPAAGREIKQLLRQDDHDGVFDKVYAFVSENGGLEYAYRRADELCRRGLESIAPLSRSVYYDSLVDMVQFTTSRAS